MVNLANCKLHVPAEAVGVYRNADTWKDFGTIDGITAQGLEDIETSATGNRKRIVNGRMFIEKDGNMYSVTGAEVR